MRRRIRVIPIPLILLVIPIVIPHTGALLAQPSQAADSLYQAGAFAAAAEAYEALARAHPDSGRVWYRLGNSLYRTGRHDAAVEALEHATATFQPASYAHYLLAQVYAELARLGIHMEYTNLVAALSDAERSVVEQEAGSHADEIETSLMLAIAPELVDMTRAEPMPFSPAGPARGPLSPDDPSAPNYAPSGSFGDPTLATPDKGSRVLTAILADMVEAAE